ADLSYCCVNRTWREGQAEAAHVCELIWGPGIAAKRASGMFEGLQKLVNILYPEEGNGYGLVDFSRPGLVKLLMGCYRQALKHRLTNPEFVFVSRTELGLCSLLHQLGARVRTREIWERVHKEATRRHSAVTR